MYKRQVYIDTGIALPENNVFVRRVCDEWGIPLIVLRPEADFWECVEKWGFPTIKTLWCRNHLKIKPLIRFFRKIKPPAITYLGIRFAESTQRKQFYTSNTIFSNLHNMRIRFDTKTNTWQFFPILEWSDDQVMDYIRKHNLPLNPCYKLYGFSSCYICPYIRKRSFYLRLREHHPELFSKILEAEAKMRHRGSALLTSRGERLYMSDINRQEVLADG